MTFWFASKNPLAEKDSPQFKTIILLLFLYLLRIPFGGALVPPIYVFLTCFALHYVTINFCMRVEFTNLFTVGRLFF